MCSTTTVPSAVSGSKPPSSGTSLSSTASPVSSARSECRRTEEVAQVPPTNPSIVPSASTIALSPARTLVGWRARTTVASTNGNAVGGELLGALGQLSSDHCGEPPECSECIASHTRDGVHGMSTCLTP